MPIPGKVGYARLSELRKGVGWGSVAHPRLSVRREDAERCEAVLVPLVLEGTVLCEDRTRAPLLVPLGLLGCKVEVAPLSAGGAYHCDSYTLGSIVPTCGGAPLSTLCLDQAMFGSEVMLAGGELAFEAMKLAQLKEELAARGSTRSGLKASLQRRLHGLLVEAAIARRAAERAEAGEADGEAAGSGEAQAGSGAAGARRVRSRR